MKRCEVRSAVGRAMKGLLFCTTFTSRLFLFRITFTSCLFLFCTCSTALCISSHFAPHRTSLSNSSCVASHYTSLLTAVLRHEVEVRNGKTIGVGRQLHDSATDRHRRRHRPISPTPPLLLCPRVFRSARLSRSPALGTSSGRPTFPQAAPSLY
jgi:hypothetical protein